VPSNRPITPCFWFDTQAEDAARQVVPKILPELLDGKDHAGAQRAMKAMLQMKKLDIAKLKQAYAG
jgi:predicted 3-demethylubiquinone-9 3-methyltransferase (glyoxalase superfamily)